MEQEPKYRVGMVSKLTGLSTHTLRMWEKRYAAVVPQRTKAGGRLYTDADVDRLRLLHDLVQSGHSIGGIAKLSDAELRQMAAAFPSVSSEPALRHHPAVRARVMEAIEELRIEDAERVLSRAALSTEPAEFFKDVLGPILIEVGDRWERGELRIAHEHACSSVMRGLLFALMRLYPAPDARRRAVVATPAREDHELGALMVAMLATMHGWSALYLGPNLPAEEIAYAVTRTEADLLMLSITNLSPAECERQIAAIERTIPERVQMVVGGRAARVPSQSEARVETDLAVLEAALSR
jgi:DNA-binding transcriptional MerR regulator/methylmalonyl-CoA mutase cobalamin-binding subunit